MTADHPIRRCIPFVYPSHFNRILPVAIVPGAVWRAVLLTAARLRRKITRTDCHPADTLG